MNKPVNKMENDVNFRRATRRLLFRDPERKGPEQNIPGAGKSAAERPERHARVKVTMNVDGDIVQYFKDRGKEDGRPYQTLMNQVLRDYVSGNRVERISDEVSAALLEDENFLAALAEKVSCEKVNSGK